MFVNYALEDGATLQLFAESDARPERLKVPSRLALEITNTVR